MRKTLVRDVMTRRVIAVTQDAQFKVIVNAMRLNRVNALPVLDADGTVRGMVSAADLVLKKVPRVHDAGVVTLLRHPREHHKAVAETAAELMTAPAITIDARCTVAQAAAKMRHHQVNQLPVLDGATGRLTGIVTRSDLLRIYSRTDTEIHQEILAEVAKRFPALDPPGLRVSVRHGIVSLYGKVRHRPAIKEIVRLVAAVEGVVHVEDHLECGTDERYPVSPLNW